MKRALIAFLVLSIAPVFAQVKPPQQELTPKESIDSWKAQAAAEKEKSLALQANANQASFKAALQNLQQQYIEEQKILDAEILIVRKENGWGDDVTMDRNPQSDAFGKWVKIPKPPVRPSTSVKK